MKKYKIEFDELDNWCLCPLRDLENAWCGFNGEECRPYNGRPNWCPLVESE